MGSKKRRNTKGMDRPGEARAWLKTRGIFDGIPKFHKELSEAELLARKTEAIKRELKGLK